MRAIYLLADSILLFRKDAAGQPVLQSIRQHIDTADPLAVYIGASNGDAPEFYDFFQGGMKKLGIHRCQQIHSNFPKEDRQALQAADLILLAGGDPLLAWSTFEQSGMKVVLEEKYRQGTPFIGISAGAINMATQWFEETAQSLTPMFNWFPFIVDVHDEKANWGRLKEHLAQSKAAQTALGICSASALVYYPDGAYELIGKSVYRFDRQADGSWQKLTLPKSGQLINI